MSISDMNKLGQAGWELVSIITSKMCNDGVYIHYFKRQIEEPATLGSVSITYGAQNACAITPNTLCNTDITAIKVGDQ